MNINFIKLLKIFFIICLIILIIGLIYFSINKKKKKQNQKKENFSDQDILSLLNQFNNYPNYNNIKLKNSGDYNDFQLSRPINYNGIDYNLRDFFTDLNTDYCNIFSFRNLGLDAYTTFFDAETGVLKNDYQRNTIYSSQTLRLTNCEEQSTGVTSYMNYLFFNDEYVHYNFDYWQSPNNQKYYPVLHFDSFQNREYRSNSVSNKINFETYQSIRLNNLSQQIFDIESQKLVENEISDTIKNENWITIVPDSGFSLILYYFQICWYIENFMTFSNIFFNNDRIEIKSLVFDINYSFNYCNTAPFQGNSSSFCLEGDSFNRSLPDSLKNAFNINPSDKMSYQTETLQYCRHLNGYGSTLTGIERILCFSCPNYSNISKCVDGPGWLNNNPINSLMCKDPLVNREYNEQNILENYPSPEGCFYTTTSNIINGNEYLDIFLDLRLDGTWTEDFIKLLNITNLLNSKDIYDNINQSTKNSHFTQYVDEYIQQTAINEYPVNEGDRITYYPKNSGISVISLIQNDSKTGGKIFNKLTPGIGLPIVLPSSWKNIFNGNFMKYSYNGNDDLNREFSSKIDQLSWYKNYENRRRSSSSTSMKKGKIFQNSFGEYHATPCSLNDQDKDFATDDGYVNYLTNILINIIITEVYTIDLGNFTNLNTLNQYILLATSDNDIENFDYEKVMYYIYPQLLSLLKQDIVRNLDTESEYFDAANIDRKYFEFINNSESPDNRQKKNWFKELVMKRESILSNRRENGTTLFFDILKKIIDRTNGNIPNGPLIRDNKSIIKDNKINIDKLLMNKKREGFLAPLSNPTSISSFGAPRNDKTQKFCSNKKTKKCCLSYEKHPSCKLPHNSYTYKKKCPKSCKDKNNNPENTEAYLCNPEIEGPPELKCIRDECTKECTRDCEPICPVGYTKEMIRNRCKCTKTGKKINCIRPKCTKKKCRGHAANDFFFKAPFEKRMYNRVDFVRSVSYGYIVGQETSFYSDQCGSKDDTEDLCPPCYNCEKSYCQYKGNISKNRINPRYNKKYNVKALLLNHYDGTLYRYAEFPIREKYYKANPGEKYIGKAEIIGVTVPTLDQCHLECYLNTYDVVPWLKYGMPFKIPINRNNNSNASAIYRNSKSLNQWGKNSFNYWYLETFDSDEREHCLGGQLRYLRRYDLINLRKIGYDQKLGKKKENKNLANSGWSLSKKDGYGDEYTNSSSSIKTLGIGINRIINTQTAHMEYILYEAEIPYLLSQRYQNRISQISNNLRDKIYNSMKFQFRGDRIERNLLTEPNINIIIPELTESDRNNYEQVIERNKNICRDDKKGLIKSKNDCNQITHKINLDLNFSNNCKGIIESPNLPQDITIGDPDEVCCVPKKQDPKCKIKYVNGECKTKDECRREGGKLFSNSKAKCRPNHPYNWSRADDTCCIIPQNDPKCARINGECKDKDECIREGNRYRTGRCSSNYGWGNNDSCCIPRT